jgi:hypothetical protein
MLVNMKGAIGQLGYVAIIAVLMAGVLSIYYFTLSTTSSKEVTTTEGLLVSSEDFNFFILKALNQSIEFIAQRAAYDLALNGGFIQGREVFWNYNYPIISDLEKNLANSIESNLPSSFKKFDKIVELENAKIIIDEQLPLSASKYFDVRGYTNISIYDETARSKTFSNFNINSRAVSSYFRLLWVAREILTNTTFNSSLNDANALLGNLTAETNPIGGRFKGLGFTVTTSGDILDVTIEDLCYPTNTYCLAPLNPNEPETKIDISTLQLIPYENLKLRFKIKAQQTGPTPSSCSFSISLNPVMGSVDSGNEVDVALNVINLGTTSDSVTLDAKAYNKTTMTQDNSITVNFDDNSKSIPYNTIMRIQTGSSTLGGPTPTYMINVTGDGCSPNKESFATYDLTVNPAMTFSINVNPDPVTLIYNGGSHSNSNSTNVLVNKLIGVSENVVLSIAGLPAGVSYTLSKNDMPPNFASVLTLTTGGNTLPGDYTITISGIGGGSYSEKQFILHVEALFDFRFYISGKDHEEVFRTKSSTTTLAVETTGGTPEPVGFTYDVVNSTGDTDPSNNFYITVQIIPSPCPLTPLIPNCYPTMNIFTGPNTQADDYTIHINASATYVWKQVSFDLKVKWGCGDSIINTTEGEQCEGSDLGGSPLCADRFTTLPPYNNPVRGGTLTCVPPGQLNECKFNTSDCIYCGNNKKEILPLPAEECDGTDASQCPGPGNCKSDCTCLTMFSNWQCSSFSGGNNVIRESNYFYSPNCSTGWYPVSCSSENAFPRQSSDQGNYGEDEIQKIIFDGNHCSVMAKDDNGNNEQLRNACVLCINKQPTVLWGVTSFYEGDSSGNPLCFPHLSCLVNGWFNLEAGLPTGFSFVHIDSQPCPLGPPRKYPISCLVNANESDQGWRDLLDDVYLDNSGICHATFRNNPEDNEKAFTINIGIVCVDKDFYQGGSKIQWSGYSQGLNTQDNVNAFPTPSCSGSDMPVSVFARNDHRLDLSIPGNYLDDVMQSTYIFGQHFNVTARDTWAPGNEQNRTVGILCALPIS